MQIYRRTLLSTLSGFDNTGNVEIWPSELVLAHSFFCDKYYPGIFEQLRRNFQQTSINTVCELGAGMTGLAGLVIAIRKASGIFRINHVVLSDGNDRCLASLASIVDRQVSRVSGVPVTLDVKKICWASDNESVQPTNELDPCLLHSFDLILASDCFLNTTGHRGLLDLIENLLSWKAGATFLAIAPLRHQTLNHFQEIAVQSKKWLVSLKSPYEYMSSEFQSYLLDKMHQPFFSSVDLDKSIGHLLILTRST